MGLAHQYQVRNYAQPHKRSDIRINNVEIFSWWTLPEMVLRAVGVAYKCLCTRQYNSILHLSEADCTPKPCQREQMIVLHVPKEVCSGNPHCPLCYIVCPFVSEISQSQVLIKYKKLLKGTDPTSRDLILCVWRTCSPHLTKIWCFPAFADIFFLAILA